MVVSPVGEVVQADTEFVAAFFIDAHRERRKQRPAVDHKKDELQARRANERANRRTNR
jgi:hypothetical protein